MLLHGDGDQPIHAVEARQSVQGGQRRVDRRHSLEQLRDRIHRRPDERGIRESQAAVERLIARERERGIAPARIVLAGFSQGGAIALQAGLRHRERLGAIVALSSYLALEGSLDAEASAANKSTPIFMAHGTQDPIVPLQLAEASQRALRMRGYDVEWHTWPMPHSVCAEEVEALGSFLARIYGAGEAATRSSILLPGR